MAQVINIIKLALALMPAILELVKALEKALPEAGQGAQKANLVEQVVGIALAEEPEAVKQSNVQPSRVTSTIMQLVGAGVSFFNRNGTFKTSAK